MDLDDDAPPELVDTAAAPKEEITEVTAKVPITIVTGEFPTNWFRVGGSRV
jgi:hypothetical protein